MKPDAILPVIMAGGAGARLWPLSSDWAPKQFQALTGPRSTFQHTLHRVNDRGLFGRPMVITAKRFGGLVAAQARDIGIAAEIVLEPVRRDSAAAVAAAAVLAATSDPRRIVLVLAADHQIDDPQLFRDAVREGSRAAADGSIVVFGLKPDAPRTGFGYIRRGAALAGEPSLHPVEAFVEKPDAATAQRYVADGYLWNSGNFLFRAGALLAAFDAHAPDILAAAREAVARAVPAAGGLLLDEAAFSAAPRTSLDYAVMEKLTGAMVVEGRFRWSDIGSWDAVWKVLPHDAGGNAVVGQGIVIDSSGTLIHSPGRRTVAVGVRDLAVIATGDTVLVMPRHRAQEVRALAEAVPPLTPADGPALPRPVAELAPGTPEFETTPLVSPSGFREYDARWWFGHPASTKPPQLNLMGAQALGLGLGTLLARRGGRMEVVTGHDYRSYSQAIKLALTQGLLAAGCRVHDIGLALTPMAYFAQFALNVPAVAMVTASHNENGWTGIKMGCEPPVTFGPEDMAELRDIVTSGGFRAASGGSYRFDATLRDAYLADLARRPPFARRIRAVVACGNGTAGAFAPPLLERLGVEVVPLHTRLDHGFPTYNPNPEDLAMLHDIARAVEAHGADIGLGFDGDGDRCGVVDNEGREIFADKIGLLLARDLARSNPGARFVVDVKSTCLYAADPLLRAAGAATDYFKTGHSYIKRRVQELGALAGFEKSGHFFFNAPLGRGYDDGLLTAIAVLDLLARHPGETMASLYRQLPQTWGSPTMSAACADDVKYRVVEKLTRRFQAMRDRGESVGGRKIAGLNTVNGVRVVTEDGTWGLVRASSNKPELVVVIESPVSARRQYDMFAAIDALLRQHPEVGAYNQTI